eukprot:13392074-Alexandrium_andersonii.AAC.1
MPQVKQSGSRKLMPRWPWPSMARHLLWVCISPAGRSSYWGRLCRNLGLLSYCSWDVGGLR